MADDVMNETRREFLKMSGQALSGVVVAGSIAAALPDNDVGAVHVSKRAGGDWIPQHERCDDRACHLSCQKHGYRDRRQSLQASEFRREVESMRRLS